MLQQTIKTAKIVNRIQNSNTMQKQSSTLQKQQYPAKPKPYLAKTMLSGMANDSAATQPYL